MKKVVTPCFALFSSLVAALGAQAAAGYDVTLADFPRLAGETDDGARLQRAVDATGHGSVLYLPKGEYESSRTVWVTNGTSVLLHKSATVRATAKMEHLFHVDMAHTGCWAWGGKRKDGRDVLAEMERIGYVSVTSQVDFAVAPCGKKAIGFFLEEMQDEESLAAAVRTALARVGDAPKGFFMMAETATTDHGNHANLPSKSVLGALQAEWAASVALDFAEKRGDTLVVVTADHETGGLSVACSPDGGAVSFHYAATSHTYLPVAVFAYGPGAEKFEGLIDNTDIGRSLKDLLGL